MAGKTVKIAAIQAEPVWNDLQGGVDKAIAYIQEAAANGTNVLGFPEVFIPGYPWSIWANSVVSNVEFMDEYFQNSMARESDEMDRIRAAVREAGIFVVLGYSERYRGTLFIAQSFIDQTGTIVHHRRKIKPTHVERAYYGDGQAESLKTVVPTPFGKVGGLNCWEHSQTLLRYYEYSQDVDIHVASWPLIWGVPADEGWAKWPWHITPDASQRLSQVMAIEGACFVMIASQILTEKNRDRCRLKDFVYAQTPGGGFSMIYAPDGRELVKPLGPGEEGILYADVDLHEKDLCKQNLDIVGHYSRPDLLSLRVTTEGGTQVHFREKPAGQPQ
ncbi:putative aliphatic nitrilase protein [Neofusicoccum parvum]|uniref:nitrilase n=1 Tax=Botryosphaeria parva (strain UCR-NP2) TaxID=1287680 RepID=R1EGX4_BOTPV|nr:putative aliphatic nitrilase protein [Neofusicoccum parvum UCRNP2]GME64450.1 putative aliphatic nitrilase protein [Neofusicoccum parvum]